MKKVHWTSLIECNYQPNSRKKLPMNSLNSTISTHQKGQHLALQALTLLILFSDLFQILKYLCSSHIYRHFRVYRTIVGDLSWI